MAIRTPRLNRRLGGASRFFGIVCTIVGLTHSSVVADLLEDVKKVRPSLAAAYERAYSQVEIHAIGKSIDPSGRPTLTQHCEYLRNGNSVRVTATTTQTDTPEMKIGGVGVIAANAEYRFQAGKADANARYKLDEFRPREEGSVPADEMSSCRPVYAYGYLGAIKIDDLLQGPLGRPVAGVNTTLDGKGVIQVVVELKVEGEPVQWQLYFLPRTWAFAGATMPFPGGRQAFEHRITYANDDPLRLESYEKWVSYSDAPGVKKDHGDIKVTSINFREVPESEFRLAALGLEEPVIARPTPWSSKLLWINALIFGGLGIWLAILAVRRRKRANADSQNAIAHG